MCIISFYAWDWGSSPWVRRIMTGDGGVYGRGSAKGFRSGRDAAGGGGPGGGA